MAKKAGSASKSTSASKETAIKNRLQGIDRKLANLAKKVKSHATDPLSSVSPKAIRAVFENEFGIVISAHRANVHGQLINNKFFEYKQDAADGIVKVQAGINDLKAFLSIQSSAFQTVTSFTVITLPVELTYLRRFNEMYETIVQRLDSVKFEVASDRGGDRRFYANSFTQKDQSGQAFITRDKVNDYFAAMSQNLLGGEGLEKATENLAQHVDPDFQALSRIVQALSGDAEGTGGGDLFGTGLDRSAVITDALDKIQTVIDLADAPLAEREAAFATLKTEMDARVLQSKWLQDIDITMTGSGVMVRSPADAHKVKKSRNTLNIGEFLKLFNDDPKKQVQQLKTLAHKFKNNPVDIAGYYFMNARGTNLPTPYDKDSREYKEAVELRHLRGKAGESRKMARDSKDVLKDVHLIMANGSKESIFDDADLSTISKLLFAAFVDIPDVSFRANQAAVNDIFKDGAYSRALTTQSRLLMVKSLEGMIRDRLTKKTAQVDIQNLIVPMSIYGRGDKTAERLVFGTGDSMERKVNDILYSILPAEFSRDMTLFYEMEQRFLVKGKDGQTLQAVYDRRDVRQDERFVGVNSNLVPILRNPSQGFESPQGDHVNAYVRAGQTLPQNLLAVTGSLNASKRDSEAGLDEMMLLGRTLNEIFSTDNEDMRWTYRYQQSQAIKSAREAQAAVPARKSGPTSIRFPADEIKEFYRERKLWNRSSRVFKRSGGARLKTYQEHVSQITNTIAKTYADLRKMNYHLSQANGRIQSRVLQMVKEHQKNHEHYAAALAEIRQDVEKLNSNYKVKNLTLVRDKNNVAFRIKKLYRSLSDNLDALEKDVELSPKILGRRAADALVDVANAVYKEPAEQIEKAYDKALVGAKRELGGLVRLFAMSKAEGGRGRLNAQTNAARAGLTANYRRTSVGSVNPMTGGFDFAIDIEQNITDYQREIGEYKKNQAFHRVFAKERSPEGASIEDELNKFLKGAVELGEFSLFSEYFR
jgi:hypothetical protein